MTSVIHAESMTEHTFDVKRVDSTAAENAVTTVKWFSGIVFHPRTWDTCASLHCGCVIAQLSHCS